MTAANRVRCQVHTTGSLLILSLAAWGLAVIHAPPAGAAFPGANGRIAFDAAIDLDYDLYVVNPSGTRMRRMFDTPSNEYEPAWSPDGSRVAFSGDRSGTRDIYAADPDGTGLLQLTSGTATDFDPAWSADGTQVVFTRLDVGYSLMVVDADGSNLQTLLHASAFEAKYSPDGTRIAFSDGNDIAVMNSNGSGLTRLTNTDDYDFSPDWSPDGSQIVFSSNRNGFTPSSYYLYTIRSDGTGLLQLTSGYVFDAGPSWSPDGRLIAFGRDTTPDNGDTGIDLYVLEVAGGSIRQITSTSPFDNNPDWQSR